MTLADLIFWSKADNETGLPNITGTELAALIAAQGAGFPERARFHSEVNITAATGANTDVPWDDIQNDTNGFFDAAFPTRMTFKKAGVYIIGFQGQWNNQNAGGNFRAAQVFGSAGSGQASFNSCRDIDVREIGTFPFGNIVLQATAMVTYAAGDFVILQVQQDSGVSLDWQSSQEGFPIMWTQRVG